MNVNFDPPSPGGVRVLLDRILTAGMLFVAYLIALSLDPVDTVSWTVTKLRGDES